LDIAWLVGWLVGGLISNKCHFGENDRLMGKGEKENGKKRKIGELFVGILLDGVILFFWLRKSRFKDAGS